MIAFILAISLQMPETPAQFNERVFTYITPEVKKYVAGLAGILAVKMLLFR